MSLNDILASVSNISSLLTLVSSGLVAVLMLKLRGDFAIFRARLIDEMERKFMMKPSTESDYPLSRREFQDFVLGAKEHRISIESQLKDMRDMEKRIRDLEMEARLTRKV